MNNLTNTQMQELFQTQKDSAKTKRYKKTAKVLFRFAEKGEFLITVCSGTIETTQICDGTEIIVQSIQVGASAETYAMSHEKFFNRYDIKIDHKGVDNIVEGFFTDYDLKEEFCALKDGDDFVSLCLQGFPVEEYKYNGKNYAMARPKGVVEGFEYEGEPFTFTASWVEAMLCEKGDMIVHPIEGTPDDIYRIARKEFDATYTEMK
jgi:peroxiredoxin